MKILLLGDYSNVHATLAEGLRALGHVVVVASDGDGWKDYPRDIDIRRYGTAGARGVKQCLLDAAYMLRLRWLFAKRFRGFDVVQIINPVFLPLRAERIMPFYRKLRRHNGRVFMAAYGMDHYWVRAGLDCETFRYSDFNIGSEVRTDLPENELFVRDWLHGPKGTLNQAIASDCDGIPAGLYEYWASYDKYLSGADRAKLRYIPFPIRCCTGDTDAERTSDTVRFFIGIQRSRSAYKGTDIMLRALERIAQTYPDRVVVHKVENVPFDEYTRLMNTSDVLLDQLYSYTPAMNALQAMEQGLVVVSGAEPEYYALQEAEASRKADEAPLRPIVNVLPTEDDVYRKLCWIVDHSAHLPRMKRESHEFIARYHDHITIARAYEQMYNG